MARAGVTYSDIAQAAAHLAQQEQSITVDAVRHVLGTGSKSTIAPLLKQWKTRHAHGTEARQAGLPADLVAAVKGLYDGVQQQADEQIATMQHEAQEETAHARRQAEAAQAAIVELQSQLTALQTTVAALADEKATLQSELTAARQVNATLSTQQDGDQQRLADREQEIDRLATQLTQVQRNLDHYRETAQQQREQERADAERQRVSLEHQLKQAQQENHALRLSVAQAEKNVVTLAGERDQLTATNHALIAECEQHEKTARQLKQQLIESESRYTSAKQTRAALEVKVHALEKHNLQVEKQMAVAQQNIVVLTAATDKAEDRVEVLRDENTLLKAEKAHLEGQLKQWQRSL